MIVNLSLALYIKPSCTVIPRELDNTGCIITRPDKAYIQPLSDTFIYPNYQYECDNWNNATLKDISKSFNDWISTKEGNNWFDSICTRMNYCTFEIIGIASIKRID